MAQDDARLGLRNRTVEDMEIAGADGGAGDPNDGVPGLLNHGNGTGFQLYSMESIDSRRHGRGHGAASFLF